MGMGNDGEQYVRKRSRFDKTAIQLISELDSPYIAKIVEVCDNEIYMEYVDGEVLSNKNTPPDIYHIFSELCDAVSALHSVGVIHRDIKPSNIMLTSDGHIKLIDFDAARVKKINQDKDTVFIGTDGFAPPEQYGFEQTDERSDIYALGVTMKFILNDNFEKSPFRPVIEKCLKFSPDQRYSSVLKLKKALALCKNRKNIMFSAIAALAVILTVSVCLSVAYKPDTELPELVQSDAQTTTSAISETTEATTIPTYDDIIIDDEFLIPWELIPTPENLPQLHDFVDKFDYEYGFFDYYWKEISSEDFIGITELLKNWLVDFTSFDRSNDKCISYIYENTDYSVSFDYYNDKGEDYQFSIRIMTPENTVIMTNPLDFTVPTDSSREILWSEISDLPTDFPAVSEKVTLSENESGKVKIRWDRMSKEELCDIANKIAEVYPIVSVSISDTDMIYSFENDNIAVILQRASSVSVLNPYQTTLQIFY